MTYYLVLEMAGYRQESFKRPIFNCREEFRQTILNDFIYLYRYKHDREFMMNALDDSDQYEE